MSDRRDSRREGGALSTSLYVHVPFCVLKCAYCSFHSNPVSGEPGVGEHFSWAVGESVAHWAELGVLDDVVSVYIGGGTPTTLGAPLVTLVESIASTCRLAPGAEITVETNPDTTEPALTERLVHAGVNRFSVGVQSFDDEVLRTLGRCHSARSAARAVHDLTSSGARVALDVMCGVPGQTSESWDRTLEHVLESGVGHVSVYPLTLEEGTPLAESVRAGTTGGLDDDLAAEMMERASAVLSAGGLERYEVASYARPGEESVHNRGYWTGRPYVGVGPASASMLPADVFDSAISCEAWNDPGVAGVGHTVGRVPEGTARVRFVRAADTSGFLRRPVGPPDEVEYLSGTQAAAEDAMLGLRLAEGIPQSLAESAGALGALGDLARRGLVEQVEDRWRVTRTGWLLGNEVFEAVWFAGARRGLA